MKWYNMIIEKKKKKNEINLLQLYAVWERIKPEEDEKLYNARIHI